MCGSCGDGAINRRRLLALGLAAAATGVATRAFPARAAGGKAISLSPDQALAALKDGNARYVASPQECEANLAEARARVAESQSPWASIVSCADSRVPPELVFGGLSLGDLFVARNAGNLVDTATMRCKALFHSSA